VTPLGPRRALPPAGAPRMLVALIRRLIATTLLLLFAWPAAASASVKSDVSAIVASSGFGGPTTGIAIWDSTTHRSLFRLHERTELKPASNMKLTTSAVALADLGVTKRLSTRVYRTGVLSGDKLTGSLWLVGGGDPSLSTDIFAKRAFGGAAGHLSDLAAAVRAAGIRRVSGRVNGDATLFDSKRTGPYWKPSYWQDCPPISALSVNKSLISYFEPESYKHPVLHAATAFRGALHVRGVKVGHDSRTRPLPAGATLVATEPSPRISRLVLLMNRASDNYFAEVLNKRVAVAVGMAGTMANGRHETRHYLNSIGVDMRGAKLYDGSGLSPRDRLSAHQILALLNRVSTQNYGNTLRASLPLAGVNGTLSNRMRSGPAYRNAQAKTGTLDDASALSGYVHSRNGHQIVFSILVNHRRLNILAAHKLQDRIVQALAGSRPRG
jgi:serine-type D-Ala-D-Ala carboxypeptidase/endopeptidase (penicillin-binding protein 4)